MTLFEIDEYFNSFLHKEQFLSDIALNGIQIENSRPSSKQIRKVAFAVDACEASAKQASAAGADLLFVHHGIFWGHCQTLTGSMYKRVSAFIKKDLALCAYHIPLDANDPYGNNYGLANALGMKSLAPFAQWRGMTIGVKGELPSELTLEELSAKVMRQGKLPNVKLNFGKKKIKTVGIVSGGASEDVEAAVDAGLDCFITGEFQHEQFHFAKECAINVIGAGHYESETVGVNLVMEKLKAETDLECFFIDIPTEL